MDLSLIPIYYSSLITWYLISQLLNYYKLYRDSLTGEKTTNSAQKEIKKETLL